MNDLDDLERELGPALRSSFRACLAGAQLPRATELVHVDRAGAGGDQIGPLERGVVRGESARRRQLDPTARVTPRADDGWQAGDCAHRAAAAGVTVQAVVDADRGRLDGPCRP